MEYKDPMRKSPTKLNGDQEYAIYKYAVESQSLLQNEDSTAFRVKVEQVAKEVNNLKLVGIAVNAHHVRKSVERVVAWQKRLGKLPIVPLETVELEQLKITKTKQIREIEELKTTIENLKTENERLNKLGAGELAELKERVRRAKAILNA